MENEAKLNIPPVQSIPQIPVLVQTPSPANLSKILLFTVLGLAIVAMSLFVGIQIGKKQSVEQLTISPSQKVADSAVTPSLPPVIDDSTPTPTLTTVTATPTTLTERSEEEAIKLAMSSNFFSTLLPAWKDNNSIIDVRVDKIEGIFAMGTANLSRNGEGGGGGVWIAKKINGVWTNIWNGQEVPLCSDIEKFQVPTTITSCYTP